MIYSTYLRHALLSGSVLLWALPAMAQTAMAQTATPTASSAGDADGFWDRGHLLGDMGGLRPALGRYGITLNLTDSENLLGSLSGGIRGGETVQGVTTGTLELDTEKAFGLKGGTFHASALQIHGKALSPSHLGDLQAANGNEAEDTTRLWELWYDQAFLDGRLDVKLGQQSIDNEFMVSQYSSLFVNTMAGWPLVPSDDLYGGGPAYPLSSPGVRLSARPTDSLTILAGVFDDNPGGGAFDDDAQRLDGSGTRFNLGTGALFIAEAQYATKIGGLAGTYKLGGWYDSGAFRDQRFGSDGLSLADAAGNGDAARHRGNYSLYAVADQTVWQSASNKARGLNVFGRVMGAPGDRNLVDFFFNGGVTLTAPLPGRDKDQLGLDFGIGHVGGRAADLDRDGGVPARGTEELIELTYQAQVTGWLVVQPDLQYVVHPGGGVLDPDGSGSKLGNELIAGARAIVTF